MQPFDQLTFWFVLIDLTLVSIALLHMLYQRRSPQSLSTWLLTIILLPYIGVLIYFFFGLRKSYSKRFKLKITQDPVTKIKPDKGLQYELDNLMINDHIAGTTENNNISLIDSDTEAFTILMQQIRQAKQQILLETYVFELDATGKHLLQELTKKAKQGVDVYFLIDAIGSFRASLNKKAFHELKRAGGKVAFFQPIWPNIITSQINLRNHRKIYLFDQSILLTGGLNISNDYLGEDTDKIRWIDLLFKIEGPACFHYQNIFNADWLFATQEERPQAQLPAKLSHGEILQSIPSGPDIASDTLYEALLHCIYHAQKSIKIATPYFIPDNNVMRALMIAVKRGVRVSVLTPLKSDHWIFDFGRSSYMRELYDAGANMMYYKGNMLHAKLIIFDDNVAMSGSANFDYRSLFLNYEMVHFLYCKATINKLSAWYEKNTIEAQAYQPTNSKASRFTENISRIFAPIL